MADKIHYSAEQERYCAQLFWLRKLAYQQIGCTYQSPGQMPSALNFLRSHNVLMADSGRFMTRGSVLGPAYGDQIFHLCDVTAAPSEGKTELSCFEGVVLSLSHHTSFLGRTIIRRDRGALNPARIQELKRVGFASSIFEDLFEAYSDDQVEARALITPDFMERMIALDQHFLGRNIQVAFIHNQIQNCLDIDDRFDFNQWRNFYEYSEARAVILTEMAAVFTVLEFAQELQSKIGRHGPDALGQARHAHYKALLDGVSAALETPPEGWEAGEPIDPDMRYTHMLFQGYQRDLIRPVFRALMYPEKPKGV